MVWSKVRSLLAGLFRRSRIENEMSSELTFHMESRAEDLNDPKAIVSAVVVTALVTAFAGYLPARRALRVDPMTALRYE